MAGEAGARKESQAASAPDRVLPPFEFPSGPFDQLRSWSRTFMPLDPVLGASMARNLYFLGTAGLGEAPMVYPVPPLMESPRVHFLTVEPRPGAGGPQHSARPHLPRHPDLGGDMAAKGLRP